MGRYALMLLVALVGGCATTSFTSFKDPAYAEHPGFKKVIIYADKMPLNERQIIEERAVEEFTENGIPAVRSLDIFPPVKTYDLEYIVSVLKKKEIDSALIVSLDNQGVQTGYVPQFGPTTTTGTINTFGNTTTFNANTYQPAGGFYVQKPSAVYSAALYEVGVNDPVWIASGNSGGGAGLSFSDLAWATGSEVVKQLFEDGLYKSIYEYSEDEM